MREIRAYHPAHSGQAPRGARTQAPRRADPAPSRWSYRKERLMLTPGFRLLLRVILPLVLVLAIAAIYFHSDARRLAMIEMVEGWKTDFQDRPQFMVARLEVAGASAGTETAIRTAAATDLPKSSFALDLDMLKARVETLPAVAEASVQVRSGGVLYIAITERVPVALLRRADALVMIDQAGDVTGRLETRIDRPGLPLLAGRGAGAHVAEALTLLTAADPVEDRIRGLERIGERRWDLVLDRGQRIMLPEDRPVQALEQVLALHQAQELLDRDVAAVDMRLAARPTVRLTPDAAGEWRDIRGIVIEAGR
ncbi:cell division protein FtsQ/DivIB [Pseudooceanicola algae]|uniref:Cell division protein FtsQ n=1 Tax=Pseudooceanicola algae TaxID=1537215 RepID=A0A418SFA7_9RHOB|nr:cell division protein FtsQ/DivIB [Pseudooceanicola algae]QPM89226.1 Cell division protein FtsQ [Pseudooceanicola algae]